MHNLIQIIYIRSILFIGLTLISLNIFAQKAILPPYPDSVLKSSENNSFYKCEQSNIPLFNLPVDSVFEFEIKTDFEKLYQTEKSEQKRIDGMLSYGYNNEIYNLPIRIKARGKTRFKYCKYKPLDIKFEHSLDSTIFEGLEHKIVITTHCGKMEGDQWIFTGTHADFRNRLFAEYYMYSMLEYLETISRLTSLCKIKYVNPKDSVLIEEYAFILESYDDVSLRCNMKRDDEMVTVLDEASLRNTYLINSFITNYDWKYDYSDSIGWTGHNMKFLKSEDDIAYILSYDFDLNAIVFPDYWKNKSESFDEHCHRFQELLLSLFMEKENVEALYQIYIYIPEMRETIEDSFLNNDYKQKFLYWLESYEFIIYSHLSKFRKYKKRIDK